MTKRVFAIILCAAVLLLCGCSDEKRIDKASIAESITVGYQEGSTVYTFYILDGAQKPAGTAVAADSLEQAYLLARQKYLPDISLAKLELIAVGDNIGFNSFKRDIEYMATLYQVSPRTTITVCDQKVLEMFSKEKDFLQTVEKRIEQLKKENKALKTDALGVYNSLDSDIGEEVYVSYVNAEKELNVKLMKLL